MLRAIGDERRRSGVRPISVEDDDGVAMTTMSAGAGKLELPAIFSRIEDAATNCPRCGHKGAGDCACPEVAR